MEEERAPGLAEKEKLSSERESQRKTHAQEQDALENEIRELQRVVDTMTSMSKTIEAADAAGSSERLVRAQQIARGDEWENRRA